MRYIFPVVLIAISCSFTSCSSPDVLDTLAQNDIVKNEIEHPGVSVTSTSDVISIFESGVTELEDTIWCYTNASSLPAADITDTISRKISSPKKTYEECNIKGCTMKTTEKADNATEIQIELRYYMSPDEYDYVETRAAQLAEELKGTTTLDTYANYFEWICTHVKYDYDTAHGVNENFSAYDALRNNYAVCYGYAALFQKLCDEAGLDCIVMTSLDDTAHAWNVVYFDGAYYHIDCTFGAVDLEKSDNKELEWTYFMCGQDRIRYGSSYGITLAKQSYTLPWEI